MNSFSFIHAADLHLDSPFKGVTAHASHIAETLRNATFEAFESMIQLCIDKEVQFLLVAGDVYDGADRSLRAQLRFRDGLARLARHDIRSFVVHGNHDALDGWSSAIEWPQGVHIFGYHKVETVTVDREGTPVASVSGISFPRRNEKRNLAKHFKKQNAPLFQIGLLHCNVGSNTGHDPYAPCELKDLVTIGLDYWALGHVHKKELLNEDPLVVYPGNTQGLSIREQNERGCYLVTVDEKKRVDIQFQPLDSVRWYTVTVGIEEIESIHQLDHTISEEIEKVRERADSRPLICRVTLTGRGSLYKELQRDNAALDILERVRENYSGDTPFVWVQKVEVDCRPEVDVRERMKGEDFIAQVLQLSDAIRRSETPIHEVLMPVLSDLFHNRRVEKAIGFPSEEELEQMLRKAELLCLDKLEPES
jgi:exonuclease SbcD